MEESWFITPPPCFTAGGLTTIKVETSPMENLLIEHPSMSGHAVHEPCPAASVRPTVGLRNFITQAVPGMLLSPQTFAKYVPSAKAGDAMKR